IYRWENPTARGVEAMELSVEKSMAAVHAAEPEFAETAVLTIRSGTDLQPFGYVYGARMGADSTLERFSAIVDPAADYEVRLQDNPLTTVGNTLYRLHYFGQIPLGIYISGLVALFFLFATVTGVMIHWRNIIDKFYAFTVRPSWKQIWTNTHTVLGMIGLPFQIVYAVTGAFYGILILLLIPTALILFGGDQQKIIAAVQPSAALTVSDTSAVVDFAGIDNLVASAKDRYPGVHLRNVRFENYGREDAIMRLYFDDERTVTGVGELVYRAHTGEILFETAPGSGDYINSVISMMGRLHFATYGGLGLRIIYFILAMLTCFMLISGVLLWQAARNKRTYTDKQKR
ncbi:MAG: PepSY-associated TM helix domain-containing protein, partial [Bacteroidota bacterium]